MDNEQRVREGSNESLERIHTFALKSSFSQHNQNNKGVSSPYVNSEAKMLPLVDVGENVLQISPIRRRGPLAVMTPSSN